ncbi:HNH endonuclease [Dryocola clanedunensis]
MLTPESITTYQRNSNAAAGYCAACTKPLSGEEITKALNGDEKLYFRYLHECFRYEASTGEFFWKNRPIEHFKSRQYWVAFKTRLSLKKTGSIDSCGYAQLHVSGKTMSAHRTAWFMTYGFYPSEIDHINHIRNDNRIINLREVTRKENVINTLIRKDNSSGVTGVSFRPERNHWTARIRHEGKLVHLGKFMTKEEATEARRKAEILYGYAEIKTVCIPLESECAHEAYVETDPNSRMYDDN